MAGSLSLPTIQNWSCYSCGNCCRHHQIVISEEERQRILGQGWAEGAGNFVRVSGGQYRLAHQADGACVFLDENNRCRIHAKFGGEAKPLACRVYPFTFHPAGRDQIAVGVRFDCPATAAGRGEAVAAQRGELQRLRELVVPGGREWEPPRVSAREQLDWGDTMRAVGRLRALVCTPGATDLATRVVHGLFVGQMLGRATFEKVRGDRLEELIDTLAQCAPAETVASAQELPGPTSIAKAQFRLIVAQYAVRDTLAESGIGYRIGKMLAGFRMARGNGLTPAMGADLARVSFAELEEPMGYDRESIDRLMERYFDVKMSGMSFCGLGCFGMNVVEGFENLMLLYPVTMYLARWGARSRGENSFTLADVERSLGAVDHQHGRSPAMAGGNFRVRVRQLSAENDIAKLAAWYAR